MEAGVRRKIRAREYYESPDLFDGERGRALSRRESRRHPGRRGLRHGPRHRVSDFSGRSAPFCRERRREKSGNRHGWHPLPRRGEICALRFASPACPERYYILRRQPVARDSLEPQTVLPTAPQSVALPIFDYEIIARSPGETDRRRNQRETRRSDG